MTAKKIAGVWAVGLDETDQSLGQMEFAAGEVFKLDVSGSDLTGLAMTISDTASGNPLDEWEPDAIDEDGVAQFRIADDDIGAWIEEGGTAYVNLWTGTVEDDRRRAYGTVKRKVSIRRLSAAEPAAWLLDGGSWSDAGVWDDTATWTEAA